MLIWDINWVAKYRKALQRIFGSHSGTLDSTHTSATVTIYAH